MRYIVQNAGDQQQGKKKQDADSGIYILRKKDAFGTKLCRRAKMDIEKRKNEMLVELSLLKKGVAAIQPRHSPPQVL